MAHLLFNPENDVLKSPTVEIVADTNKEIEDQEYRFLHQVLSDYFDETHGQFSSADVVDIKHADPTSMPLPLTAQLAYEDGLTVVDTYGLEVTVEPPTLQTPTYKFQTMWDYLEDAYDLDSDLPIVKLALENQCTAVASQLEVVIRNGRTVIQSERQHESLGFVDRNHIFRPLLSMIASHQD